MSTEEPSVSEQKTDVEDDVGEFEKVLHSDLPPDEANKLLLEVQEKDGLYTEFTKLDMEYLSKALSVLKCSAGETIMMEGEDASFFGIILGGTFNVEVGTALVRLPMGCLLGEMSYFEGGTRSATVRSDDNDPGFIAVMTFEELNDLGAYNEHLQLKMCRILAKASIRKLRQQMARDKGEQKAVIEQTPDKREIEKQLRLKGGPGAASAKKVTKVYREALYRARLEHQKKVVQSELSAVEAQKKKAERIARISKGKEAQLKKQLRRVEAEVRDAEAISHRLKRDNTRLRKLKKQVDLEKDSLEEEHTKLQESVEKLRTQVVTKGKDVDRLEAKIVAQQKQVELLRESSVNSEHRLKLANEERAAHAQRMEDLEGTLTKAQSERKDLHRTYVKTVDALSKLQLEFDSVSNQSEMSRTQLRKAESQVRSLQDQVAQLQSKIASNDSSYSSSLQEMKDVLMRKATESSGLARVLKRVSFRQFYRRWRVKKSLLQIHERLCDLWYVVAMQKLRERAAKEVIHSYEDEVLKINQQRKKVHLMLQQPRTPEDLMLEAIERKCEEVRAPIEGFGTQLADLLVLSEGFFKRNIELVSENRNLRNSLVEAVGPSVAKALVKDVAQRIDKARRSTENPASRYNLIGGVSNPTVVAAKTLGRNKSINASAMDRSTFIEAETRETPVRQEPKSRGDKPATKSRARSSSSKSRKKSARSLRSKASQQRSKQQQPPPSQAPPPMYVYPPANYAIPVAPRGPDAKSQSQPPSRLDQWSKSAGYNAYMSHKQPAGGGKSRKGRRKPRAGSQQSSNKQQPPTGAPQSTVLPYLVPHPLNAPQGGMYYYPPPGAPPPQGAYLPQVAMPTAAPLVFDQKKA